MPMTLLLLAQNRGHTGPAGHHECLVQQVEHGHKCEKVANSAYQEPSEATL